MYLSCIKMGVLELFRTGIYKWNVDIVLCACVEHLHLVLFQGGIFEALSFHKVWKAYKYEFQGSKKLVFSLRRPKSCVPMKNDAGIKITTKPKVSKKDWDFEISGYFPNKECSIIDSQGNVVAQVRMSLSL